MKPLTDEDLERIERACAGVATKLPWTYGDHAGSKRYRIHAVTPLAVCEPSVEACVPPLEGDAAFICAASEHLPRLVAEVRRLEGELWQARSELKLLCGLLRGGADDLRRWARAMDDAAKANTEGGA